jgi:DNA-binding NarL/FixJ family response regulator
VKSNDATGENRRILIVDDHPVFRLGLITYINAQAGLFACCEASSSTGALTEMRACRPHGAIVDISLPGINGIELIKIMRAEMPKLSILVVSMHKAEIYALRALRAGALGYITKDTALANLLSALHQILRGGIYVSPEFSERLLLKVLLSGSDEADSPAARLSQRELQVLELLGRGLRLSEIASQLSIGPKTVETHCRSVRRKFGFRSTAEIKHFAAGWIAQKPA